MQGVEKIIISDCEGPISKNDNAYELSAHFIPNGEALFVNISCYDDILADVFHKPGYAAGSTLRLILPFFKAYDITDEQIDEFCTQNICVIPHIADALSSICVDAKVFIVSTSYEHYIKALCKVLNFPYENTYCTKVNLYKYTVSLEEKNRLRNMAQEIAQMPRIKIPPTAVSFADFSTLDQAIIRRLDEIFWSELPKMNAGKLLTDVVTIGGPQKADAICDVVKRLGVPLSNVMYVGDSITDVEAFKLVSESGGLAVSFNGNGYAVKNAAVAVLSESALVTAVVADLFCRLAKDQVLKVLRFWCRAVLNENGISITVLKSLFTGYTNTQPNVQVITPQNMEQITKESCAFREKIRGENIGRLG
ncbi:MAG: HAD hydrolase family protein [Nitrososphaerota archaeon]|jgi:energy-converting hydrogenase A subunit R|nr:HAD hydrolase family protein [Nitrososphaerota archaeon]